MLHEQKEARQILERSIQEGLEEVLGRNGAELVSRLLPIDLAAADPRKLHELLVSIFKEEGALVIEREIARRILDKMGNDDRAERPDERSHWGERRERRGIEYDAAALRRLAELADLPANRSKGRFVIRVADGKRAAAALDPTAVSFAEAFTAGK